MQDIARDAGAHYVGGKELIKQVQVWSFLYVHCDPFYYNNHDVIIIVYAHTAHTYTRMRAQENWHFRQVIENSSFLKKFGGNNVIICGGDVRLDNIYIYNKNYLNTNIVL